MKRLTADIARRYSKRASDLIKFTAIKGAVSPISYDTQAMFLEIRRAIGQGLYSIQWDAYRFDKPQAKQLDERGFEWENGQNSPTSKPFIRISWKEKLQ